VEKSFSKDLICWPARRNSNSCSGNFFCRYNEVCNV